ncbi:Methyltransferase domain-containing protein [Desulfonatronum thiosulfatophilum]|uniref:Methyltransferase domain-containing protein n=1 Tax=Desulfonatronum thiosulfatophilum TaxID=617002 RepID=A0A1G6EC13_9BACT|nr:class I SAM-dependent methyltransferase [Desulfonatronum thiosulfatophilum]SDB54912.1 Methyltransferase domain-containing protein [Desulfonatronum thiosulfatophilum]
MKYTTDNAYTDRETKPAYVYDKYNPLLLGSVLDVGADGKYLKPYVEQGGGAYCGIGFGERVDMEIDLDAGPLPFEDTSFDTVLCLDVLEHLEKIHFMFHELCRVARKNVIISLPNPYGGFLSMLRRGDYAPDKHLKFYGLPVEPPSDRHRWFFSTKEAKAFLRHNASNAGYRIVQLDSEGILHSNYKRRLKIIAGNIILKLLFRKDVTELEMHHGTLWCCLEKCDD